MPWEAHTFAVPWDVVWFWYCVPLAERRASSIVANGVLIVHGFGDADVIDLVFQAETGLAWEKRLAAWRGNWQIGEETVTVDDVDIRLYTSAADWVDSLAGCQFHGGCGYGADPCPTIPAWSHAFS